MSGIFITFEGGEGAGKTTAITAILERLEKQGRKVLQTREPGGSIIAEKIREVILDPDHVEMDGRTEALLYAAARRQHLVEKVIPALNEGYIVLCDRFVDSSLVYQGAARGLGFEEVLNINMFATEGMLPDKTVLFDIEPEVGLKRITENRGHEVNRLDKEKMSFHKMVRQAYLELAEKEPQRIEKIDASQSADVVVEKAWKIVQAAVNNI